jgi:hypothetical protein
LAINFKVSFHVGRFENLFDSYMPNSGAGVGELAEGLKKGHEAMVIQLPLMR